MKEESKSTRKNNRRRYKGNVICDTIEYTVYSLLVHLLIGEYYRAVWGVAGVKEKDWEDGMELRFKGSNMLQTGTLLVNCSRLSKPMKTLPPTQLTVQISILGISTAMRYTFLHVSPHTLYLPQPPTAANSYSLFIFSNASLLPQHLECIY